MLFSYSFYSSLLLVFFIHLLVYSLLFLIKYIKTQQLSSFWMSLFLLLSTLYFTPWMVGFAGWYDTQPYRDFLFYTPFQHLLLLGPVLFFYTQSLLNPALRLNRSMLLHFIPAILYLVYSAIIVIYDKFILHDYGFLASGQDPDFDPWYQLLGFVSMSSYLVMGFRYHQLYVKSINQVLSNTTAYLYPWLPRFFFACITLLFIRGVVAILGLIWDMNYINTWWYFLCYAICCYYIAILSYSNAVESKLLFRTNLLSTDETYWAASDTIDTEYVSIPIAENTTTQELSDDLLTIKESLLSVLEQEQVFLNPELTLVELSKQLNTNASILSKVINKGFGQNFNDLINQYRINIVIGEIEKGLHKKQTLLSIAYDCGFNSKATFNRAFKKVTNFTPVEYIQQHFL